MKTWEKNLCDHRNVTQRFLSDNTKIYKRRKKTLINWVSSKYKISFLKKTLLKIIQKQITEWDKSICKAYTGKKRFISKIYK